MTPAEEAEMLALELELEGDAQPSAPPAIKPQPSAGDAALAGVQQLGSFGFGDELGAGLQATLAKLSGTGDFGETYRQARGENREQTKAAKDAHPVAYYAAGAPAGVVSAVAMPAVKAGQGAALLTRALAGGATGLLQGGLAGVGDSEADTVGGLAADGGKGALVGGTLGTALPIGGAVLRRALAPITAPVAKKLEETAIDQGRRVLTNGADSMSKRNKVRDDAVAEAIRGGGITPFGTTKGTFERLKGMSAKQYATYNEVIDQLAEKGVRGPDAQSLAQKLLAEADALQPNTLDDALPEIYRSNATKVLEKAGNPRSQRLGLVQSENLKRSAQDKAQYGRIEETPANEIYRNVARVFREGNEEAIDEQVKRNGDPALRALGAQFVPVKQKMGRLIEATSAAERGTARGAQRNAIGMKDVAAATAAAAAGRPGLAIPAAIASNLANNRLPSAVASFGLKTADALRRGPNPNRSEVSPYLQALLLALRNQGDSEPDQEQAQ